MLNRKLNKHPKHKTNRSFISKLYDILNDNTYNDIIHWDNEGSKIIIINITSLCDVVLPKFYKHSNYSSFVRQLNMYGFHRSQGIIKDGVCFEHEFFNKKMTKEQINQIIMKDKKKSFLSDYFNIDNEHTSNSTDIFSSNNEKEILKQLLDKIEENSKSINQLQKDVEELNNQNKNLNENLQLFQNHMNGHSTIIEKIFKMKNEDKNNKNKKAKKSKNINELFNKYLYHLKIYSPYVTIEKQNSNIAGYRFDKTESIKINNINYNNIKGIITNNNINIGNNFEDFLLLNPRNNINSIDLNTCNNNSLSFIYPNKEEK